MKLSRVTLYTRDIPRTADMFIHYFGATLGETFRENYMDHSAAMLTFPDGGEILLAIRPGLTDGSALSLHTGPSQIAISTGSREKVREITMQIYADHYTVVNMPRETFYGTFESTVLDFDGNFIVITE